MNDPAANLLVKIKAPDLDENELADVSRLLRNEIEALDVESVEPVKGGDVPDGAMAGEWYEIGVLSIELGTAVLPPLILLIKSWLDRQAEKQSSGRKKSSSSDQWKVKFGLGPLSVEVDRTTSKQEIIDKTAALQKQIEKK